MSGGSDVCHGRGCICLQAGDRSEAGWGQVGGNITTPCCAEYLQGSLVSNGGAVKPGSGCAAQNQGC